MAQHLYCIFFFLYLSAFLHAEKIHYQLTNEPIDVVIVCHPKDKNTLEYCIDGIRENCSQIRRVIVVSPVKLTDKCEWFDEKNFPFDKNKVAYVIGKGDKKKIKRFVNHCSVGWYFQQLLKLYAPFVIPEISSNVLMIDADTIFMNPVVFLNPLNGAIFCMIASEGKPYYFEHAQRLVPGYQRIYPGLYCVTHHMLFQKPILIDLFETVEKYHQTSFWIAFCLCVEYKKCRAASEYEIYFNFAMNHTDQLSLRPLIWMNSGHLEKREQFKNEGYHFVSFHDYMREK
jgi:hypothetical protein